MSTTLPEHELQKIHRRLSRIAEVLGNWDATINLLDAMRGKAVAAEAFDMARLFGEYAQELEAHPEFLEMLSERKALADRGQELVKQINGDRPQPLVGPMLRIPLPGGCPSGYECGEDDDGEDGAGGGGLH